MSIRGAALVFLVVAAVAACGSPVALRTASVAVDACDEALLAGELVASNLSGLAVRNAEQVSEVIWPFGYSATREVNGLVLHDETGKVVAHEGQRVEMSGGLDGQGVWKACAGSIHEVSNAGG